MCEVHHRNYLMQKLGAVTINSYQNHVIVITNNVGNIMGQKGVAIGLATLYVISPTKTKQNLWNIAGHFNNT